MKTEIRDMKTEMTELEKKVIDNLINELYAEPGFSDVSIEDLEKMTEIPMKKLRGVLGSLTKKDVIWTMSAKELGVDRPGFTAIVYLADSHYYLHPEWKDEDEMY